MTSMKPKITNFFRIACICGFSELFTHTRVASFLVPGSSRVGTSRRKSPIELDCPLFFSHHRSFSSGSSLSVSINENNDDVTTTYGKTDDVESGGFFWDFQGHSCYARVDQPTTEELKKDEKSRNKKPIVLLIHGFACSTLYWRETRAYLNKAGYTVHSVDLLGQGRSSKPGRQDNIVYSIDLWAKMVDDYARRYIDLGDEGGERDIVLVGNSLGSTVALSAASGDCYDDDDETARNNAYLPSRVKGLCFFNCGVGLNTRNALKAVSSEWLKTILNLFFDLLNLLVFNNKPLLTYVLDEQVSKETIRSALLGLYPNADDPESKVDDELVDSFINPVLNDPTPAVVEVLSQIYTNDAGRTPMEMHGKHPILNEIPIHLIWGDKDPIAPVVGDVGTFYSQLAASTTSTASSGKITLELVEDAGHVPFDEKPECNSGLIKWLDEKF